jgi:hypothetical protein
MEGHERREDIPLLAWLAPFLRSPLVARLETRKREHAAIGRLAKRRAGSRDAAEDRKGEPTTDSSTEDAGEIARKLANPVSDIWGLQFQQNTTFLDIENHTTQYAVVNQRSGARSSRSRAAATARIRGAIGKVSLPA